MLRIATADPETIFSLKEVADEMISVGALLIGLSLLNLTRKASP